MFFDGKSDSYGEVDDNESIRAIRRALAWLWGRSEKTIPIPDFKTTRQIEENIAAMEFGPLSADQMRGIEEILGPRSFTY